MTAPIIVLEGLDACGKSTQTELLLERLAERSITVGWRRFPGYSVTNAGARISAYLRGELGNFHDIPPQMIAALYAADRIAVVDEVEELRQRYDVVLFDRGVTSNLIYTPARATDEAERQQLSAYVEQLEYDVFGFPRESLVLFLDASPEARAQIHHAKGRLPDLHEADEVYLAHVREVALQRCETDFRWVRIPVDTDGALHTPGQINDEILQLVTDRLQR